MDTKQTTSPNTFNHDFMFMQESPFPTFNPYRRYKGVYERAGFDVNLRAIEESSDGRSISTQKLRHSPETRFAKAPYTPNTPNSTGSTNFNNWKKDTDRPTAGFQSYTPPNSSDDVTYKRKPPITKPSIKISATEDDLQKRLSIESPSAQLERKKDMEYQEGARGLDFRNNAEDEYADASNEETSRSLDLTHHEEENGSNRLTSVEDENTTRDNSMSRLTSNYDLEEESNAGLEIPENQYYRTSMNSVATGTLVEQEQPHDLTAPGLQLPNPDNIIDPSFVVKQRLSSLLKDLVRDVEEHKNYVPSPQSTPVSTTAPKLPPILPSMTQSGGRTHGYASPPMVGDRNNEEGLGITNDSANNNNTPTRYEPRFGQDRKLLRKQYAYDLVDDTFNSYDNMEWSNADSYMDLSLQNDSGRLLNADRYKNSPGSHVEYGSSPYDNFNSKTDSIRPLSPKKHGSGDFRQFNLEYQGTNGYNEDKEREDDETPSLYTKYPPGTGPCRSCQKRIMPFAKGAEKAVYSKTGEISGQWHRACFVCAHSDCDIQFNRSIQCYVYDDQAYCHKHYHTLNRTMCQQCFTGIEGECVVNELDQKWHAGCLKCVKCACQIKDDYYLINDWVYCEWDALNISKNGDSFNDVNGQLKNGFSSSDRIEKRKTRILYIE